MQKIATLCVMLTLAISACTNSDQKANQNNGNGDTSMKSMDATGPKRDTPNDTLRIDSIPGDSVPMRDDKEQF